MPIRKAIYSDIKRMTELLYILNKMHQDNLPNDYKSPDEIAQNIDIGDYITNEQKIALVAYLVDKNQPQEKIVGFILGDIWERKSWVLKQKRIAMIMDIVVDEMYQGQGIGRQLYQAFESQIKTIGVDEIMVEIYDFNKKAITFYQHCGIEPYIHVGIKKL